jgi:glycine/D-amino acid oxidase-like deaminating enzyme
VIEELPFWHRPAPLPPGQPPARTDAVVVGAGITGMALLHHLQAAGVAAVVLERDRVAAGATGRNAGFLLTGTAEHYRAAVKAYGRGVARDVWEFTATNHDLLLEVLGPTASRACGHRREGTWTLVAGDAEADDLREAATLLAEDGLYGIFAAAPTGAPPECKWGLVMPRDGEIDPAAAVASMAQRSLAAQPGSILEGTPVRALEASARGARVHLDGSEIEAGAVLLATNAWAAELAPLLPIAPVRAQMLATAPERRDTGEDPRPTYSHRGHRYWRRLSSGELLLGGCRDVAPEEELTAVSQPSAHIQDALEAFLRTELGAEAAVTHRWAGVMGFSPDGLPLVGQVPGTPGVYICGGYTGHGMGFAVNAARTLVAHITGGVTIPGWLDAGRSRLAAHARASSTTPRTS